MILGLATFLVMAAGTACVEPIVPVDSGKGGAAELTLRINAPSAGLLTKAELNASSKESKLYDLWIWFFDGNGNPLFTPVHRTFDNGADGYEQTLSIPSSLMETVTTLKIYVLGNGPSVGFPGDDGAGKTLSELQNQTISGDDPTGFGRALVQSIPTDESGTKDLGLPMSYCGEVDISFLKYGLTHTQIEYIKNYSKPSDNPGNFSDAQWTYVKDHWNYNTVHPTLELIRAVSKVRFLFAETTETISGTKVTIESLRFDDDVIPNASYLFPRVSQGSQAELPSDGYEQWNAWGSPLVSNTDILQDDSPMRLRNDSNVKSEGQDKAPYEMDASTYEKFLDNVIGDHNKNSLKTLYLRESDRSLTGTISYKVVKANNVEETGTIPFNLASISPNGFHRNLSNLVYVYFDASARQIVISTTVLPWVYTPVNLNGSNSVNVDQDGKFVVNEERPGTTVDKTSKPYQVKLPAIHDPLQGQDWVEGRVVIYGPEGWKLRVTPNGDAEAFELEISGKEGRHSFVNGYLESPIDASYDRGKIFVYIRRKNNEVSAGKSITLSFSVVNADNSRVINADSEIIDDDYEFIIPTP